MPVLSFARFVAAIVSLLILGAGVYLLWSWWQGDVDALRDGTLATVREPWRLWSGLAMLTMSFLGRPLVLMLSARRDERPTLPAYGEGEILPGRAGDGVYVERVGPVGAPPIIFTHGWGMDSTFWRYAKEDLRDRFRLTVWDLPGLGKSRGAHLDGINLERFADELANLVETAGGQRPVLVGHSIGGMTIQTLLRDNPQVARRLAGIVLLNTTYTNPLRTIVFSRLARALQKPLIEPAMHATILLHPLVWLSKWQSYLSGSAHLAHRLGFGRYVTRSQLEHVTLLSTRNPPAAQARGNLAMLRWDATGATTGYSIPVLVLGGDMDIVTKLEANRRIADEAGGEFRAIAGVNHLGPMERADLYNQLIADFTLQVQPATGDTPDRPLAGQDDGEVAGRRLGDSPDLHA